MQTRFAQFVFTSWRFPALGILAFISLAPSASAAALGTLNVGQCNGGGVSVTLTTITWLPTGTVGGTGCIATGAGTGVTYSAGTLGADIGNIMNLVSGGAVVDDFMTFQGTNLDFKLDGFVTGFTTTNGTDCTAASAVADDTCVVFTNSPFLLTNLGNGNSGISVTAVGTITDGGVLTDWSGSFTTSVPFSVETVQSTELAGGTLPSVTYSGQFTVTSAPEPASWSMIAAGLIVLPIVARRRKARVCAPAGRSRFTRLQMLLSGANRAPDVS